MKCTVVKDHSDLNCTDIDGVRYCKRVMVKEEICMPEGYDYLKRLTTVLQGLNQLIKKRVN